LSVKREMLKQEVIEVDML